MVTATEAAADAIVLNASTAAGGIDITSNADIDITTTGAAGEDISITNTGGSIAISATENAADVITITANGGISEKIVVTASQGTGADAISLLTSAGGITLTAVGATAGDVTIVAGDDIILTPTGQITISGTASIVRTSQQFCTGVTGAKLGSSGAGWVLAAADDLPLATLPQSQTAEIIIIPIHIPLKVGWTITAFALNGQIESAGGAVTLDADLRKVTEAAAGYADASVGTITQIAQTADYKVVDSKASLAEVVAADEWYYLKITGTTAATTDIEISGYSITVSEI